ncbi:MAG: class I SAM-dependent methyltransferase [Anaerolineae bacterium]
MSNGSPGTAWLEEETARRYKIFTEKSAMYQELSRFMVELAGIKPGMRVLDLGCGTGLTSQAALDALGANGHIYAVDISDSMLAVARERLSSKQVTFLQADGAAFADLIEPPLDRVVCNSVFWQFRNKPGVLAEIRRVLAPGGRFVFNVPESYLIFKAIPRSPKVAVLFKQLASERYGVGVQDLRSIEVFLNNHGFEIVARETFERVRTAEESYLFMQIPVATAWMEPPLSYTARMELLAEARQLADPDQQAKRRWMYFVTQPRQVRPKFLDSTGGN